MENKGEGGVLGKKLKCILVGDEGVGKSAIVTSFRTHQFSTEYHPTIHNNFAVRKRSPSGDKTYLDICDTGGQKDFDRLRPLCYADVDVFLICFDLMSPISFQNVMTKWLPEIKRHSTGPLSEKIILLVGTKSDLRSNTNVLLKLSAQGQSPVSEAQAMKLAKKIGAKSYIECSSMAHQNVKQIFDHTLTWGINRRAPLQENNNNNTVSAAIPPQPILRQVNNNLDSNSNSSFRMRGTSGHFFRWKSYNQKRKRSASTELKKFILMCCAF